MSTSTFEPGYPSVCDVGGKINLYLEIRDRRPDGYHELATLFHPLPGPVDTLNVEPGQTGNGLTLTCSEPGLACPDNLVARAYAAFCRASGLAPDLRVHLEKRIPSAAGLGGGSADAAAMLKILNARAEDRALSPDALARVALSLGADVPFFLLDGPAWATGVGEALTPVKVDLSGLSLVLVCPDEQVPTARAYGLWDSLTESGKARGPFLLTENRDLDKVAISFCVATLFNSFEQAVFPVFPGLRRLKERCLILGAAAALMSGSGSSLFALFRGHEAAQAAAEQLRDEAPDVHVFRL